MDLKKIKAFVAGQRPRPRVYVLTRGERRRVLSIGPDWVRIYKDRVKCRVHELLIDQIEIEVPFDH